MDQNEDDSASIHLCTRKSAAGSLPLDRKTMSASSESKGKDATVAMNHGQVGCSLWCKRNRLV